MLIDDPVVSTLIDITHYQIQIKLRYWFKLIDGNYKY